ncbi:hypothetical protein E8E11_004057 [Didymella keratinophila]|nr:hypothetical protein E8E11_004057 [Didymella keratinophila]
MAPRHDMYPYHCSREFHMFIDNVSSLIDQISEVARILENHEDQDEWSKKYHFAGEEDDVRVYCLAASLLDPRTTTWHREAYIRATTGALSINLVHLLKFDKLPRLVRNHQKYGWFYSLLDAYQEAPDCLYMASSCRLDQIIQPGSDHLFMLDGGTWKYGIKDKKSLTKNNVMFLVLRANQPDLRIPRTFKLLTADVYLFHVQRKQYNHRYWKTHYMIEHDSVASRTEREDGPGLEDSITCAIKSISDQVDYLIRGDRISDAARTLAFFRAHQSKYFRLAGVWQQIFPGHAPKSAALAQRGDCIVLTINATDWRKRLQHYYLLPQLLGDEPGPYESQYRAVKNDRYALPRSQRFKPAHTAFMELYFEIDGWKGSKYAEGWRKTAEKNIPGYRRRKISSLVKWSINGKSNEDVRVRARKNQVVDYIVRDLVHMMPPLRAMMKAYEPCLSIEACMGIGRERRD